MRRSRRRRDGVDVDRAGEPVARPGHGLDAVPGDLHRCSPMGLDDAGGGAVVLGAVGGVDLVVQVVRLDEENVIVDPAGVDAAFVTILDTILLSWSLVHAAMAQNSIRTLIACRSFIAR